MINDQELKSQSQNDIGDTLLAIQKNPSREILFKKAYQLWRQHRLSVPDAMKIVELSDYFYSVVVDVFDLYLQLECEVEFPEKRIEKRLPPREHFANLNLQAAQSSYNKFEDNLTPSFALFSFIRNGLSSLDYNKYESEEDARDFKYKVGDIVSKRHSTKSLQVRYGDLRWKIILINADDITVQSLVSTAKDVVSPNKIIFVSRAE